MIEMAKGPLDAETVSLCGGDNVVLLGSTDAQSAYKTNAMTGDEIAKLCANEKTQCFQFISGYLTALETI